MTEVKKVKIQNFIETQIPEFLNIDNPIFKEFLNQYYISQEHQTGNVDLASNFLDYKSISNFNTETFFTLEYPCILQTSINEYETTIEVNHTVGFPTKYGLLKIGNEIITYTSKTDTTFNGCIRGFSGITNIKDESLSNNLNFTTTVSEIHSENSVVQNLNLIFFEELFRKFKYQFIPGTENRNFASGINLQRILSRAKDFYISKGTDTSYKILFKVLYKEDVEIIKPQEFMLRPSDNKYFITSNILVEKISGGIDPLGLIGETIYQSTDLGLASGAIYNVEIRPVDGKFLYEISIDSESTILDFNITGKTKVTESVDLNVDSEIIVDSTIGFPDSGTLLVQKSDGSSFNISYESKTLTQFLNITYSTQTISVENLRLSFGDIIIESDYAYVLDSKTNDRVDFRVIGIIGDIDHSNTYNLRVGDTINLSTFGLDLKDRVEYKYWLYNVPTTHKISSIENKNNEIEITFVDSVQFVRNSSIEIFDYDEDNNVGFNTIVKEVTRSIDDKKIRVSSSGISGNEKYVKKVLTKVSIGDTISDLSKIVSNIQNTYIDRSEENLYVSTNGFPSYQISPQKNKFTFISSSINGEPTDSLDTTVPPRFYTGEKVYIKPLNAQSGLTTGIYFVSNEGNVDTSTKISLSYTRSDLFIKKYISVSSGSSFEVTRLDYNNLELTPQNLLKSITLSPKEAFSNKENDISTENTKLGILVNGVELYSPTTIEDSIYYGKIESIEVSNSGKDYDVITPPELEINDEFTPLSGLVTSYGSGAKAHLNITGSVKQIKIIEPGYGYDKDLKVSIGGGNGSGATLETNIIKSKTISGFRGDSGVNPNENIITFTSPHNFDDGELVEYFTEDDIKITFIDDVNPGSLSKPLANNSYYYVGVVSDNQVKLYSSREQSSTQSGEINLGISTSKGYHYFRTLESKNTLIEVNVKNSGFNYSNKRVILESLPNYGENNNGINTNFNYIYAKNHNLKNKDLVVYSTTGTSISGISTDKKYFVKVIDQNKFRLANAGIGNSIKDLDYNQNKFVKLNSIGAGTHTFAYPPITIEFETSPNNTNGKISLPKLKPVVVGEIESVFLENGGVGYGASEIINYHRRPVVTIKNPESQAVLRPVIVDGKVIDVQILSYGKGYVDNIDLIVNGDGKFAELYPIFDADGRIVSVNVINTGDGYNKNNTTIQIQERGKNAKFIPNLFQWKVNQVAKTESILDDGGLTTPSKNLENTLQYINYYPSKKLRIQLEDNITRSGDENLVSPSSILGWSYDGFPIYGPYFEIDNILKRVKSGYTNSRYETNPELRPSKYPPGFFIQDYTFITGNGDLDEYNGRFIVNEDFPEGTYAYFATIDVDNTPMYPYVIGSNFKGVPKDNTINYTSNIDSIKNNTFIRNTSPYYLNSNSSSYGVFSDVSDSYKQEISIDSIEKSKVESVEIYNAGENYKVGDIINFTSSNQAGTGIYASVFELEGREISSYEIGVSTYSSVVLEKYGNVITAIADTYFNLSNNDIVTIKNISDLSYEGLSGTKKILLETKEVGLAKTINNPLITNEISIIYPNDITGIEIDDYLKIDSEIVRVLEIYPKISGLRVLRLSNTGFHTAGLSKVSLLPRKFTYFSDGLKIKSVSNKTRYFDAENVVSSSSGITSYISPENEIIQIPSQSIYIPNHGYQTGQTLKYHSGIGGSPLQISDTNLGAQYSLQDSQVVYVVNNGKDFIGITTTAISSSVYFSSGIIGIAHSFTTVFSEVSSTVENYYINIQTTENHGLEDGDLVKLNLSMGLTQTIKFRYDINNRKITTELIDFDSTGISTSTNQIFIDDETLRLGDKVIYYSNGAAHIGGLQDNEEYFVLKKIKGAIQLSEYYSDALNDVAIDLTSIGSGTHSLAKINPEINVLNGSIINFDLEDSSLSGIPSLKLYRDYDNKKELERYNYILNDGSISLNLLENTYPNEIYYGFEGVESDDQVLGNNKIKINPSKITSEFKIIKQSSDNFKISLNTLYDSIKYNPQLTYTTRSKNSFGPIKNIKINYSGSGYEKNPKVSSIESNKGKNAILIPKSTTIGKIDKTTRVKDGFDYPTDPTLLPLLSVPAVVNVEGISRIDYIGITSGGSNYNNPPTLKVIGNDKIILNAKLKGTSVDSVEILQNTNDLLTPLQIVPTKNSNGYGIDNITVSGENVTLELINVNFQLYPLITTGYGKTETIFPFKVGDEVFVERCRIVNESDAFGNPIQKDNFNSSDYNYRFFTITGVSAENYTITYSMQGVKDGLQLGDYTSDFGYGYVVNKKNMAQFEMFLANDLSYYSNEKVLGYDSSGTNTFVANVMKDGWDNDINELRLVNVKGSLNVGDTLFGETSLLSGKVVDVNIFNIKTFLDSKRYRVNDIGDRVGFLNDYYQRISDNSYYQKFSYSIVGKLPYEKWKESVRSLVHPSGFKEFSDLTISSASTVRMNTQPSVLDLTVNIDNVKSLYEKNNFAMVVEEDLFEDGSSERIKIEQGQKLKSYILAKTNKVILIDDISSEFNGVSKLEVVAREPVTFISTDLYRVGVSTNDIKVGDIIGYSTYHNNPDGVQILYVGEGFVEYSKNSPHRLYSVNGITTSVTETLDFYRRIPGDITVGITSFKLKNNGTPLFYREFDSSNGLTTSINIENDIFILQNHNFQTGQKIIYTPKVDSYSAIAVTSIGSGAILEPVFNTDDYSVKTINIINGGSGYNNNVSIAITGTKTPHIVGVFTGIVESGKLVSIGIGNSGLGYYPITYPIGIQTTSEVEGRKDIIIEVSGGIGSAIYENGYNSAISTSITGTAVTAPIGTENIYYNPISPYIPVKSTSGVGVGALFSVLITYDVDTGNPLDKLIILRDGGKGYSVGDTVSIAGTYLGGATPANDLSFKVSKISNTKIGNVNQIYSNIPGDSIIGYGTEARFNVTRTNGFISSVSVVNGGKNYKLTDNISISGTYIGGSAPADNLWISPTLLGTDKLPGTLYVDKINKNQFKVSGVSTGNYLNILSFGIGTHSFYIEDPSPNTFIAVDNIVQTPVYKKPINLVLGDNISYEDTEISIQSGISSIILNDYIKIDEEYLEVKNIGTGTTNTIIVERGKLGTKRSSHNITAIPSLYGGNYRVDKDVIYFSTPPYGPVGIPGFEVRSSFNGRAFSRRFDPFIKDENLIFDDISDQFTGVAATEFKLKSQDNFVSGMFTDINGTFSSFGNSIINQNPFILLNNVLQTGGTDYIIDTPGQNTIKFISGVPNGGKITNTEYTTGFGYYPLVGASATVSVSAAGTISNVYLTGFGLGYTTNPSISIVSGVGTGGILTSNVSASGTITSLSIINPGFGYTSNPLPEVRIDLPQNSYRIPLVYSPENSGIGTGAKASVIIGNGSSVTSLIIEEPGTSYKVGDVLIAPGIKTDPNAANFKEFKITVTETYTDSFSGWYPGQFIQFDDISPFFNGIRKRFTPTVTLFGVTESVSLISQDATDLSVSNNLFVFINDVLQVPNEAYTFTGTRIVFTEAPVSGSKCTILFFRGSDLDVEQIDPPKTIKEGDSVRIYENVSYPFDRSQFERVVKDIISADTFDTLTYDSIGISSDVNLIRPLSWIKQTQNRVINGSLFPKSRPDLKSKITPSARIIKDVKKTDTEIYVDSAVPLFSDIDENKSVSEDLRDVTIVDNTYIEPPQLLVKTSEGGYIFDVSISNPGFGYKTITNPEIKFNKSLISKEDPLYDWEFNLGISTSKDLNSIGYGTGYISVGNSGLVAFSYKGETWQLSNNIDSTKDFNNVIAIGETYISVGSSASVYRSVGLGVSMNWNPVQLLDYPDSVIVGEINIEDYIPSEYNNSFNKVSYNLENDTIVAVGDSGGIFRGVGISSTYYIKSLTNLKQNLNSIANNGSIFVLVGDSGSIYISSSGDRWINRSYSTTSNLNDVIWDGTKFIAVGDFGIILTSPDGSFNSWTSIVSTFSKNIKTIKYFNKIYTVIDSDGYLYYSFDLINWVYRALNQNNYNLNDIIGTNSDSYISVGSTGFIAYSVPTINRATAISTVTNGQLSSVTLLDGGFGYPSGLSTTSLAIVESEPGLTETIYSIKAKGDFGRIKFFEYLGVVNVGSTTSPRIRFTLLSENYPVVIPTMEYSPISVGDYFVITNSNIISDKPLVAISTLSQNIEYVGTSTSFIDGIYRADEVITSNSGITTVTCAINNTSNVGGVLNLTFGTNTNSFYGNYSYGIIYDYQNRARSSPKDFIINKNNGLVGISTGPIVLRTRGLV